MVNLIIATLATFGVAALVSTYDGPFDLFRKLRDVRWLPFHCTVCTSVWVAPIVLALLAFNLTWLMWGLAVIGSVILIERLT